MWVFVCDVLFCVCLDRGWHIPNIQIIDVYGTSLKECPTVGCVLNQAPHIRAVQPMK